MPRILGKVNRQQLPTGQDGQVLVLDTRSPNGIAWRSGVDRLITDLSPELSGDLECNDYKITGLGTPSASTDAASKGYADGLVTTLLEPAYGSFNKSWDPVAAVSHTITKGASTWFTQPNTWTRNVYNDWEEVPTNTGTFRYTGDYPAGGSRTFVIHWGINLWYYVAASYVALAGRIRKTDADTGIAEVAGSAQLTGWDHYLLWLGNYYYIKSVSGTAMVSLAAGDTIQFEYGVNSFVGSGTTTLVANAAYESGATLNIQALD